MNWTVGRPGNEATKYCVCITVQMHKFLYVHFPLAIKCYCIYMGRYALSYAYSQFLIVECVISNYILTVNSK